MQEFWGMRSTLSEPRSNLALICNPWKFLSRGQKELFDI